MKTKIKRLLKSTLLITSVSCSGVAFAERNEIKVDVGKILVDGNGFVQFWGAPLVNPANCKQANRYEAEGNQLGAANMLNMLLRAQGTSRQVKVVVDTENCSHGKPVVKAIYLESLK